MKDKLIIIIASILIIAWFVCFIVTCVRYDNYTKELKEKANKYDLITNESLEVKDE